VKRVQSYTAPGITVTFDPTVCVHSAVCLSALPAVFDVQRRRWIRPEAASVAEVTAAIDRCPSGALRYVLEGQADPTSAPADEKVETKIQTSANGPLLVRGDFQIVDENGAAIACEDRVALCRCGATGNQPFCDGSHRRVGFQSKKPPSADSGR
jgi:uncharacterized Fe-S cluster protein YjdI/CDGSH-type Zn-finger protein